MHFELSCLPQPANDFSAASSFLKINLPSQQQMPLCKATFNLEMTSATTHWPEFPAPSRVMRLRGAESRHRYAEGFVSAKVNLGLVPTKGAT